jgi:multiple sugar transport system ATP-binding protein
MITLNNVRKFYGSLEVIKGVDITVEDGEFAVFVGPSGCGKSTLLRMIAGLEGIDDGDLVLNGKRMNDVPPDQRDIRKQVEGVAEILQLTDYLDRRPGALSGGQRQRVAIGRAIIKKPSLILFDEPLSNLDSALRVQMRAELQRLHRELKATVVYVTHDQVEAMTMADKIVVLNKGLVAQQGAPMELYHKPDNEFVATFIGSPKMNVVAANAKRHGSIVRIESPVGLGLDVTDQDGRIPDGPVRIGARPEHMKLVGEGAGNFVTEVSLVERLGVETYLTVGRPDEPLIVRTEGDMTLRPGDRINLNINPDVCHVFNAAGDVILPARVS